VQQSLALSGAWCLYMAVSWTAQRSFHLNRPLSEAASSFVVSGVGIVSIVVLDKALVLMTSSWVPSGIRGFLLEDKTGGGDSTAARALRLAVAAVGMLISVSWARSIATSIDTIALATPLGHHEQGVVRSVLAVGLAAMLLYPWLRGVLPKARRSESEHAATISRELEHIRKQDR